MAIRSLNNFGVPAGILGGDVGVGSILGGTIRFPTIPGISFVVGDAIPYGLSALTYLGTIPGGTPVTAAAAPVAIDLSSLTDLGGGSIALLRVKALLVLNWATTDGQDLTLDFSVTNAIHTFTGGASGKITVKAGAASAGSPGLITPGMVLLAAPSLSGYVVTPSTGHVFNVDPGANTVPYTVIPLGNTA